MSKHRPLDESSFEIDEDFLALVDSIEDSVILYKINKRPRYLAKALNKASIEVREAIETWYFFGACGLFPIHNDDDLGEIHADSFDANNKA